MEELLKDVNEYVGAFAKIYFPDIYYQEYSIADGQLNIHGVDDVNEPLYESVCLLVFIVWFTDVKTS